jgi:glucose/arabinose dehydrogenase
VAGLGLAGCAALLPSGPAGVTLPPGFTVEIFAAGLGRVRFLALDPRGTLVASIPEAGRLVALADEDGDGRADVVTAVLEGLDLPHGLAFHQGALYVAETGRVIRVAYDVATRRGVGPAQIVARLPARGAHWTRTIVFGPDGHLYVSVGSSCNVCEERDPNRAAITRYAPDGSGETRVATGLKNAVGIRFRPGGTELWATVNGRDGLGEDVPPDYITRVEPGGFYGWPYCYWDTDGVVLDPELPRAEPCRQATRPTILYQAHSAPLGLAFYTGTQFPPDYRGDLFVALHGSTNRLEPTGYKVIRIRLGAGAPVAEDFLTGPIGMRAWGRPVDLLEAPDGSLFLSDDRQGVVYRIRYRGR